MRVIYFFTSNFTLSIYIYIYIYILFLNVNPANMELLLYITKRECDRYSSLNMCVAALYKIYILMESI